MSDFPFFFIVLTNIISSNLKFHMIVPFILVTRWRKLQFQAKYRTRRHTTVHNFQSEGKSKNKLLPQITYFIRWLKSKNVVENYSKSSKISTRWQQYQRNYTQDNMSHTSKTFQSIHTYSTKSEEFSIWILHWSLVFLSSNRNLCWYIFI